MHVFEILEVWMSFHLGIPSMLLLTDFFSVAVTNTYNLIQNFSKSESLQCIRVSLTYHSSLSSDATANIKQGKNSKL